jgi:hypothetical protein
MFCLLLDIIWPTITDDNKRLILLSVIKNLQIKFQAKIHHRKRIRKRDVATRLLSLVNVHLQWFKLVRQSKKNIGERNQRN